MPPSKMPSSRFISIHSRGKNLHKSSGMKSNIGAGLSKKRYKTKSVSAKIKLVKPKNKALKRLNTQTRILKPRGPRKLVPSSKRAVETPTKLSKLTKLPILPNVTIAVETPTKLSKQPPPRPKLNNKNIAPAPKAVPLAPVKILKIPPLTPKLNKATAKKKVNSQQIATRSYKSNKQTTSKLLVFKQGGSNLSDQAKKTLDSLSIELKAKPNSRMQLKAYAGEPSLSSSKARRLSLSRALSVRSYLIKNGIRSTRIDVRALGNKTSVGEPNRVDLNIIKN